MERGTEATMQILVLLLTLGLAGGQAANDSVKVETGHGAVVGVTLDHTLLGTRVNKFLGIPFAKPPTGDRRFKPPESADRWDTVFALEMPDGCPQAESYQVDKISEDCLYLNIWAPEGMTGLPVMIWIYGGGLVEGAINVYDGTMFAAYGQVVYVAVNYRVNIFGFLRLNDEEAPGNVGLLDQYMAIQWVHDNIQAFGGDPGRITVFGESAGAFSTLLHTMTPLPRLFQNVIVQSGYGIKGNKWGEISTASDAAQQSRSLATLLGCDDADDARIAACMRSLAWQDIVEGLSATPGVTIDGQFLTEFPSNDILESTEDLSVIIGTNENEGMFLLQTLMPDDKFRQQQRPDVSDAEIATALYILMQIQDPGTVSYLREELYAGFGDNLNKADAMLGDAFFTCPTMQFAGQYSVGTSNKVYMYQMNHATSVRTEPEWTGANHGLEIDHVFGEPIARELYPYRPEESELSRQMVTYWTNLAKYRTPNFGNVTNLQVWWPEYVENEKQYLILDVESSEGGIRVDRALREKQCRFWDKVYPGLTPDGENLKALLEAYGLDDEATASGAPLLVPSLLGVLLCLHLSSFSL